MKIGYMEEKNIRFGFGGNTPPRIPSRSQHQIGKRNVLKLLLAFLYLSIVCCSRSEDKTVLPFEVHLKFVRSEVGNLVSANSKAFGSPSHIKFDYKGVSHRGSFFGKRQDKGVSSVFFETEYDFEKDPSNIIQEGTDFSDLVDKLGHPLGGAGGLVGRNLMETWSRYRISRSEEKLYFYRLVVLYYPLKRKGGEMKLKHFYLYSGVCELKKQDR